MISISLTPKSMPRFRIDCADCQIRHKAICAKSDADELARLNSFKSYVEYHPDQIITLSGDPLDYVGTVVNGVAEISMALEDGRRQILGLLMPGDFIGRPDRHYCKYDIRAILTGESNPVGLRQGDQVFAGEINLNGVLHVAVTGNAEDSVLSRIIAMVRDAETSRNRYTNLADRAAGVYAPVVHLTALAAFVFWLWMGKGVQFSLDTAIAVLIITCPCALGLAVPAVIASANNRLFRGGVLLKTPTALEHLAKIDRIVFDKTGTLSTGAFTAIWPADLSEDDQSCLLALAALSHHPYAKAIVDAVKTPEMPPKKTAPKQVHNVKETPSKGL